VGGDQPDGGVSSNQRQGAELCRAGNTMIVMPIACKGEKALLTIAMPMTSAQGTSPIESGRKALKPSRAPLRKLGKRIFVAYFIEQEDSATCRNKL